MRSGPLNTRLTLQQRTLSRGTTGEEIETWTDVQNLWAARAPQSVVERFASDQRFATVDMVFRIRWYPFCETMLNPKDWRFTYRGNEYYVLGLYEIGVREGAYIATTARTDTGGSIA